MVKDILAAIDAEIATLEQAKALLRASGAVVAKRKLGRPAKAASVVVPKVQKGQEATQDECGGTGAHPASADQALGRVENPQREPKRQCRAAAQGEEESREGCLIGLCSRCR